LGHRSNAGGRAPRTRGGQAAAGRRQADGERRGGGGRGAARHPEAGVQHGGADRRDGGDRTHRALGYRRWRHHGRQRFDRGIRKHVAEKEIDYIVMGTKGASGWSGDVIGTNTGNVITKVKCPILVIPEHASYKPIKEIVFPTDFNIFFKNRVLTTLSEAIQHTTASLSILYISKKVQDLTTLQKKNRTFLDEHLEDKPHNYFFITDENIETAIDTFVKSHQVDMIAMVAKNLNYFQRILFKPTVEKLSYYTTIPFLVLHE
jgi:nucleotide-binding universal stress UspA family protein